MKVTEFCSSLDEQLSALTSDKGRLEVMARAVSQAFRVKPEEVAIFSFDSQMEMVSFLWPLQLRNAGTVPLSAHNSLVTKTIRDNRATIDNSFTTTPHASIFEQFRLGPDESSRLPIHKIMSAPLSCNGEINGVIQVSRKGQSGVSAGDDFSSSQLAALTNVAEVVARFI
jgi:hypothetical protein